VIVFPLGRPATRREHDSDYRLRGEATQSIWEAGLVDGDTTDDAARWWRPYQLAGNDQVDELRRLADAGDDDAELWLARWLADCDRTDQRQPRQEAST
jgi:hypothetical protein